MTHIDATDEDVGAHLRQGLELLERASIYAQEFEGKLWEFAVEIDELRAVGLTNADFRWLICKEFVECRQDVSAADDFERRFAPSNGTRFDTSSCFVLTDLGAEFLERLRAASTVADSQRPTWQPNGSADSRPTGRDRSALGPRWDPDRHQLRLGEVLVKEFKINSPNQEAILMAFEEEGWPPRVSDPLAPQPELDPKERLRNTIKSLNRRQLNRLIRFLGDGTGQAVRWELFGEPGNNR